MTAGFNIIIRFIIAIALAVVLGSGSVVAFNNIRPEWFEDYDDSEGGISEDGKPRKVLPKALLDADREGRQRLPSTPWKYAFTGYFGITGVWLSVRGGSLQYEIAVMCILWVVLEMAISDQLYKIVPDQFNIALAVMSVAFFSYHDNWWEPLAGAGMGLGISLAVYWLGRLLFGRESIGGADAKFFTCIGFTAGRMGICIIYILTTLLFAVQSVIKIASGKGSLRDMDALMPAVAAALTIYFLFLHGISDILVFEM